MGRLQASKARRRPNPKSRLRPVIPGQVQEERLVRLLAEAIEGQVNCPNWVIKVRPATPAENHKGIDVVITTGIGGLFLQVKTSDGAYLKINVANARGVVNARLTSERSRSTMVVLTAKCCDRRFRS